MRSTALAFIAGVVAAVGGLAVAQHGQGDAIGPTVRTLSATDIDEEVSGKKARVTFSEVTYEPGGSSRPHRHPGPVFGYVLEGELEFAIDDQKVRTLKAGDTFYEPAMVLHAISRNPSDKARTRMLAVLIHPRDAKELVIPEPQQR